MSESHKDDLRSLSQKLDELEYAVRNALRERDWQKPSSGSVRSSFDAPMPSRQGDTRDANESFVGALLSRLFGVRR